MLPLTFPTLNVYSTPLLLLVVQGYIFAYLLLKRYIKERQVADLFLAVLLFITGYNRTTYIVGFMDWYDTFQNTKINYALINFSFALGPALYFYVKSVTTPYFKFSKKDRIHFLPLTINIVYDLAVWAYDASQPGFDEIQNGVWISMIEGPYVSPFLVIFSKISLILYFAFSIQAYWIYRKQLRQYFSNTYKVELKWIRNFLIAYVTLFTFQLILDIINDSITQLHWTQKWWGHFAGAVVMIYVGIKGYFIDLSKLYEITFSAKTEKMPISSPEETIKKSIEDTDKKRIIQYLKTEKPYLNADLTLSDLAKQLQFSTNQLSLIINTGFNKNFKDFINAYRVETVKKRLEEDGNSLTLLGIAYECGFNSKATFNRTFKKFTGLTPSEYKQKTIL